MGEDWNGRLSSGMSMRMWIGFGAEMVAVGVVVQKLGLRTGIGIGVEIEMGVESSDDVDPVNSSLSGRGVWRLRF